MGIRVSEVVADGPAHRAGLCVGDIILAIGAVEVALLADFEIHEVILQLHQ